MIRAVAALLAAFAVHQPAHHHHRPVPRTPAAVIAHVFRQTAPLAACFARRESGLYPRATHYNSNGTIDRGLFQINSVWVGHTVQWYERGEGVRIKIVAGRLYNAAYNARVAWAISRGGTYWAAWGYTC